MSDSQHERVTEIFLQAIELDEHTDTPHAVRQAAERVVQPIERIPHRTLSLEHERQDRAELLVQGDAGFVAVLADADQARDHEGVSGERPARGVHGDALAKPQGIPEDQLDHIFIPFYSTREAGSGVGLSFSQHIMRMHKGRIHVRSRQDEGTEIQLIFSNE